MFWNKRKNLKSEEYKQLKNRIDLLEIDLELLTQKLIVAIKRKAIKKEVDEAPKETKGFDDGFDELRKFYNPNNPS